MPRSNAAIELGSSSISLLANRKETLGDGHFRWQSIQKFIVFACTFSSTAYNFDIFSKVCDNVRLIDVVICEATLGIAYMCMDSFIKQYTRKFDCIKNMSPLLRGISYGRFMQTSIFVIFHASYLSDSLRFLVASFREVPPWTTCEADVDNITNCIPLRDVMVNCNNNETTLFASTSAYFNYIESFGKFDRNTLTTRFFILGLVWMLVFFLASVTEETMVKVFKLAFTCRSLSTVITLFCITISTSNVTTEAFSQIVDIASESQFMLSFRHITYAYGIGFLGVYDFGTMSAFTMVDTAAVIFVAAFTMLAFMRSWIIKILYLVMTRCIVIERQYGTHVLFYAILPLSTEFLYAHKLYVFYFYGNVLVSTLVYMTNLIYILSKFLSYEFQSVKLIYIVGLLCWVGFAMSTLMLGLRLQVNRTTVITAGVDIITSYLGGAYVAIVMWLYGLTKFCTDIQFWLGFRPTRFWTISWSLLPVALFCCTIRGTYEVAHWEPSVDKWIAIGWAIFTFFVVAVMNIKSMAGFLMRNNLAGLFKSHRNYGPPEPEDRKRRLYYSEYTRQRKCKHNCLVIDEWFECNHEALTFASRGSLSSSDSEASMMNLYDAKTTSRLRSIGALSPMTQHHS